MRPEERDPAYLWDMIEAARRVSSRFRNEHADIPWKETAGLRNVISHEYDKVNYTEIYRIVHERIPELITLMEPLIPPPPRMDE